LFAKTFRKVCGQFSTGIGVVTVSAMDGSANGLTVNSFALAKYFVVNILRESQKCFSQMFASRQAERFSDIGWGLSLNGLPMLEGVPAQSDGCRETVIRARSSNRRTGSDSSVLFCLA
jgi:flavin reductase (DIM6/NTAB) family NADH-FMN oxidoreductase RutF